MRKLFKASILFTLMAVSMVAEAQDKKKSIYGGIGYFGYAYMPIEVGSINTSLSANGIPVISQNFMGFGGGGLGFINNIILGGEGVTYSNSNKSNANYKMNSNYSYGLFNIGLVAYDNPSFIIYPLIGLGGSNFNIEIYENSNPDFDALLQNPKRGVEMSDSRFLAKTSMNMLYFPRKNNIFFVGLKAGYAFSPGQSEWTTHDQSLSNGPNTDMSAPFVQIMLGAGGLTR